MNTAFLSRSTTALLLILLAACQPASNEAVPAAATPAAASLPTLPAGGPLAPLPGKAGAAPAITEKTTLRMQTTAGELTIEVYAQAAPNAVQRFIELAQSGFFDATPISRVVPGFVAQFGINWREPHNAWQQRLFDDDPTLFSLERGTLAFAKAGPNTNSTQVFINYTENNQLASPQYNFTVFGKVVSGMEVVDRFVQVGDPAGGLDQGRLWAEGGDYLNELPVKPTMIETVTVVQ